MKKILLSCFLVLISFFSFAFAASDIHGFCKTLLETTKGTKAEKTAIEVCKIATVKQKAVKKVVKTTAKKGAAQKTLSDTKISMTDVKKLVDDSVIKGDKSARYLIVEYSDLQCPFCQRHWNAGTLDTIVTKYKGKVSKTLRHFPLSFHKLALPGAIATECAREQGKDNYFKFIEGVFAKGLSSDKVLAEVAKSLKLDEKKWKECLTSDQTNKRVGNQMNEGIKLFNITGTPGNVILDTVTGQYKIISGAYPASEFEKVFDALFK